MLFHDLLIFIIGFLSAFVGSISGGSGLVGVPALLLLGLPPHMALGTYNFGDLGSKIGNILQFSKHKNVGVKWKEIFILTLISIPATVLGALLVVSIDSTILSKLIGIVLIILIPLLFLNRNLGVKENKAIGLRLVVSHIAFFFVRVWTGFFSPGSGLIEAYIKMRGYGYTILQGKAVTRIPHVLAGIGGVIVFIVSDFIDYRAAILMFLGMFVGGYVGMGYAIKKGDEWLKPILGVIILVTAVKMIFFD